MATWQLQEAKSKFSEMVKRALSEGPQGITVRGEPVAVLVSRVEYTRLTQPKPGFVKLMRGLTAGRTGARHGSITQPDA